MRLLGLDLGTTNVKAAVVTPRGRLVALGSAPVSLHHVGEGGVEQDLEEIWRATIAAIRQATREVGAKGIRAIGISSQGGALQRFDAQGRPAGRVISWLDGRGQPDDEALTTALGRAWFAQRIGHGGSGLAIGQLLRLRREMPGATAAPNRIGFVGDAIVARLCGRGAHDATSAGLTLLYNPARRCYDPDVLERLGLDPAQLPDLVPPRREVGTLLREVAEQTGLPRGIPVSAAIHDQYAAALGTGVVRPGEVMFGAGTAWVLLPVMTRLRPPVIDDAFVCQHVVEGVCGQILSLRNGGSAVAWALRLLGRERAGRVEVDALAGGVAPGSDGLRFWPFLTASGAAGVDARIAGRLSGLRLSHTSAHFVRAVLEGLACELNRYLEFLRASRIPVRRLVMCGGAASSRVTPGIIADVTGLPVACAPRGEGSVLGAAILARGLVETGRSLDQLAAEMVARPETVEPGPGRERYRAVFAQYRDSLAAEPAAGAKVKRFRERVSRARPSSA